MAIQIFTVVLDRPADENDIDALFEAGCDDAVHGLDHGELPIMEFDREADTMAEAIASAIRAVDSTGLAVMRVREQELLTVADIAERVGRPEGVIAGYAESGRDGFPAPVNPESRGTLFYRWGEAASWLGGHLGIEAPATDPVFAVANLVLEVRKCRNQVPNVSALTDLLAESS